MKIKLTILGCGNSTGVPSAGNYWGKCDPSEPKNRRLRPSVLVQAADKTYVIDTGPDFTAQMNRADIQHIDGVFYTHSHGDHMHGIDDLKRYAMRHDDHLMPIYTNEETLSEIQQRFYYLFATAENGLYRPMLKPTILNTLYGQQLDLSDNLSVTPFEQFHGDVRSVGYRFGDLAYSTDVKALPEASYDILRGVKTWIVDAAGYHQDNNPVHANLNEVYAMNARIGAQQVYLTSLSLAMDYQTLRGELPKGYAPLYDGLQLDVLL